MDAVEFIKERRKMYTLGCIKYGINDYNTKAEDVVKEVEEWSAAHPYKTRQSVFLGQWPEAELDNDGILNISPCTLIKKCVNDPSNRRDNLIKSCRDCRREFWMQEVE